MRRIAWFLAALFLLSPAPAAWANWSLGTNLGLSVVNPTEGGNNTTVIAWPDVALVYQPGLRIGFAPEKSPHMGYIETGYAYFSSSGSFSHWFQLTGNYQYNFHTSGSASPYLTAGLGLVSVSLGNEFSDVGATSALLGLGIGVRRAVADGHGTIRAEVRYDHVTEGDDSGDAVIRSADIIGLKLGFDLWMK